ncbi:uncharacterized protein LOC118733586 isoform X3 [Rhagoletis pomonella]|uniref:uncharacterized protein LOC118733586 isoform X3 n=1 Tax=Rhagoletis pomonella TaxID=28610 RepID=UPI0017805F37|nr:uncharacterized protein LOC118733586 isoform X3 [Rhagoletis pomonella]
MRQQQLFAIAACLCSAAVVLVSAVPVPADNQELDVLQIPLSDDKELDVLTLGAKGQEQIIADRNKRTIGLLRELFPDITKNGATDTQIDLSAINKQLEETIRVARQVKEAEAAAQAIAQQQQQQTTSSIPAQLPIPSKTDPNAPIQLSFNNEVTPLSSTPDSSKPVNNDLRLTESKSPAIDELTLDSNEDAADLDDRNKRFLSFGGAGVAGGSSGNTGNAAAGGGSGNFLFDIIRLFSGSVQTQTGDEAANGANSVAGGGDSDGDSDANRAADGFTEGIPGPVTRLVVLANRGLANLIQDLILRIAATSEKFVNFKAKLITALI